MVFYTEDTVGIKFYRQTNNCCKQTSGTVLRPNAWCMTVRKGRPQTVRCC